MMEATGSSGMLVNIYHAIRVHCHISEESSVHNHCHENFKSHISELVAGAGLYGFGTRKKLSFSLGQYTILFQAEVYAIVICATGNIDEDCKKGTSTFCRQSSCNQSTSLLLYQLSKLIWNLHQFLMKLSEYIRIQLISVPGHREIEGNEIVSHLARASLDIH
jgi:hypothetical protein